MAKTAADLLVEGIIEWGIKVVFGIPGDGIKVKWLQKVKRR